MKRICDCCHGNGYVTDVFEGYADCPTCNSQGEYEHEDEFEEAMGASGAERKLGE